MHKIIKKEKLAENITLIEVLAPQIAKNAKAGQFVVLRLNENGERIPLTIADKDPANGIITIIFQHAGATTKHLASFKVGDSILNLLGPLGMPAHIEKLGHVVVIGGGVGIAEILSPIKAYKSAGNKVTTIIGARCKELLILQERIKAESDEVKVTTDDGTCGRKGFVSDVLKEMIEGEVRIDLVYCVGPVPMMQVVSEICKAAKIPTVVSLNPLMLDATGMCGVCRVEVGGEIKFGCVDGPEFDGHLVNFDALKSRLNMYKEEERVAEEHMCRLIKQSSNQLINKE